jgi:ferredoxin
MIPFTERYPLNTPGKYYITGMCTDCDFCRECAPQNIRRDDRTGTSYVFRQPTTPEEVGLIDEGVQGCPTEAVRNDGDQHDWATAPIYDWNALYAKRGIRFDLGSNPLASDEPRS